MVQIFEANPNSTSAKFNRAFGQLANEAGKYAENSALKQKEEKKKKAIMALAGEDGEHIANLPDDIQKLYFGEQFKQQSSSRENAQKLSSNNKILRDLEDRRQLEPGSLQAYESDPSKAELVTRPSKPSKPSLTSESVPKEISTKIKNILDKNKTASSDELRILMDEEGVPPIYSNPYTENRRRTEEQGSKSSEDKVRALRQETLSTRTQLSNKAMTASQGIQNKEHLLDIIKKGKIDDPTFAALAEALPLKLGKRLLSNDTVEYKSGLVEEFGDLRNIFQGQTRVKEIELLEEKIADLYLNDEQKQSILKSRINALKADIIRAEVAQEIENEPYGILQFSQELEKRTKPRLEALFHSILDEQSSIINNAERRKSLPLDANDPDDQTIIDQILQEAGGDYKKAEKIALKKGYKF